MSTTTVITPITDNVMKPKIEYIINKYFLGPQDDKLTPDTLVCNHSVNYSELDGVGYLTLSVTDIFASTDKNGPMQASFVFNATFDLEYMPGLIDLDVPLQHSVEIQSLAFVEH